MAGSSVTNEAGTSEGIFGTCLALALVAVVLVPFRESLGLVSVTALLFLVVILVGLWSTWIASTFALATSGFVLNACFMVPYGTLKINATEDIAGLIAFATTGLVGVTIVHNWKVSRFASQEARNRAARESERANRGEQRLTWLNQLSHDVRTPLSTIRAVVEDMHDKVEYDQTTRAELLDIAVEEIDRLDRLVGNWLLLGAIDQQPIPIDHVAVDVGEVVTDAARRLSPVMQTRTVNLKIEADIDPVDGSFSELRHLVMNLLANAATHSSDDGRIDIAVGQNDEDIVISIQDSGPGFPPGDPNNLLKPFIAGPASKSTGLGLSICSEVTKRHHGRIELSTNDRGGLVEVSLPRRTRRKVGG